MGRDYPIQPIKCRASRVDAPSPAPALPPPRPSPRDRMPAHPQHLMHFEGGNALSAFRAHALLHAPAGGRASASPRCAARHVHWVRCDRAAGRRRPRQAGRAAALRRPGTPRPPTGALVVVMPRLGTVSPWASKATDIAHNCGLAVQRVERVTEYRLSAEARPARRRASRCRPTSCSACAALLHDRMTESVAFEREAARHLFDEQPAPPLEHVDVLGAGRARRCARPTRDFGLALSDDEIDYLVRRLHAAAAQPQRRRADDVRAGQQRALPAQDLQRRVHASTAQDAAAVDVRHDPPHREATSPQHTVVAYSDNAAVMEGGPVRALAAAGLHQRAAVRRARRDRARADEGGDAQPPDGDLALPGRVHRRRRRDPRRRRHRPRRAAQGRPDRLLGVEPAPAGHRRALGARARSASPAHIASALQIMIEGPLGGAAFNNEFGRPNLGGYFRVFEQPVAGVLRGYHKPIMIAGGLGAISDAQTHKLPFGAGTLLDPARRPGHAHRHGRRRRQLDGRGQQHRGAGFRLGAARQPRDPAPRAGGHQPLLGARRDRTRSWRSTTSAPAASAMPSPSWSTAPAVAPPSTCARCRWKRAAWRRRRSGATRARSATCWRSRPRACRCSRPCASASAARSRSSAWRPTSAQLVLEDGPRRRARSSTCRWRCCSASRRRCSATCSASRAASRRWT